MDSEAVYTPSQVGDRLGLKSGMVRRYHLAYEAVTGEELPRDPQTNGRLVTDDALSVLERARNLVRESPSLSVEDAIRSVLGFVTMPTEPAIPNKEVLELLLVELRRLGSAVERQNERLAALEEENVALRRALTPSSPTSEGGSSDPETLAELEEQRRLNAYLKGEIVRRDLEAEAVKRPWWKWW